MLREADYYLRMIRGWHQFIHMPRATEPKALVREAIAHREDNFLELMRRAVFERQGNPYRFLFEWAGCTYDDLGQSVRRDGLDATLESLRRDGVYLTHDQFKGKTPVKRGPREILVDPGQLANPLVRGAIETSSSGGRSRGTTTRRSLEYQYYREALEEFIGQSQYAGFNPVYGLLVSILPSSGGLRRSLNFERRGHAPDRWFALGGSLRDSTHYRLFTDFMVFYAKSQGVRIRLPDYLPHDDFRPVAHWLAGWKSRGRRCVLRSGISRSVRTAAAAVEEGLDISGSVFIGGGEAITDAKRTMIEATGSIVIPAYAISELGPVGWACTQMDKGNCVHVFRDSVAVISYRRLAPLTDTEVDSLMFTSILPCAATVLVNVDMEDSGVLSPVSCDCELTAIGLNQQISDIYSYGKLTGQGMTLVGSDVVAILEAALPARFGGAPGDYQLVECEGVSQTEVELRVHPRLKVSSTDQVQSFFLTELRKCYGGSLSSRTWVQTNGIRVVFGEPYLSGHRKTYPLHLLGAGVPERKKSV